MSLMLFYSYWGNQYQPSSGLVHRKPPVLSALISSKTGIQSARQWTVTLTSTCFADEAQIDD